MVMVMVMVMAMMMMMMMMMMTDSLTSEFQLSTIFKLDDAGVIESLQHLKLTLQIEVRVTLSLEAKELLLVNDLHCILLSILDFHARLHLAEVPGAQRLAKVVA